METQGILPRCGALVQTLLRNCRLQLRDGLLPTGFKSEPKPASQKTRTRWELCTGGHHGGKQSQQADQAEAEQKAKGKGRTAGEANIELSSEIGLGISPMGGVQPRAAVAHVLGTIWLFSALSQSMDPCTGLLDLRELSLSVLDGRLSHKLRAGWVFTCQALGQEEGGGLDHHSPGLQNFLQASV